MMRESISNRAAPFVTVPIAIDPVTTAGSQTKANQSAHPTAAELKTEFVLPSAADGLYR